eukprot:1132884-Pleurochrysis_carterae.AAC.4
MKYADDILGVMKGYPLTTDLVIALVAVTSSQPSTYTRIKSIGRTIVDSLSTFGHRLARVAEIRHGMPH